MEPYANLATQAGILGQNNSFESLGREILGSNFRGYQGQDIASQIELEAMGINKSHWDNGAELLRRLKDNEVIISNDGKTLTARDMSVIANFLEETKRLELQKELDESNNY
jgi:hypothetical protein